MSSAISLLSDISLSAISFKKIINKRVPRTRHCGTPTNISQYAEELF